MESLDPSVVFVISLDTLMTCHNLHSPPPSYDLVVLNEYNEFLQYRANKQKYAQVASVVQHNVVADNSFVCVL